MTRKELNDVTEAVKLHEENLMNAMKAEKWMAAVWKVENGKVILQGRTTWVFPKGDFNTAVDLLKQDCQKELDAVPATAFGTILPRACDPDRRFTFGAISTEKKKEKEKDSFLYDGEGNLIGGIKEITTKEETDSAIEHATNNECNCMEEVDSIREYDPLEDVINE